MISYDGIAVEHLGVDEGIFSHEAHQVLEVAITHIYHGSYGKVLSTLARFLSQKVAFYSVLVKRDVLFRKMSGW